jgi:hypothetical protein
MVSPLRCAALLFALAALSPIRGSNDPAAQPSPRRILVSVIGERTRKVRADLPTEAFQVEEDGKRCLVQNARLTDQPAAVVLLFDCSGSAGDETSTPMQTRLGATWRQASAKVFMRAGSPENEYLTIGFADEVELLRPFTRDRSAAESSPPARTGVGTALYDAVSFAISQLADQPGKRKAIVAFSDFEDNLSKTSRGKVTDALRQEGIMLFGLVLPGEVVFPIGPAERLIDEAGGLAVYPRGSKVTSDIRGVAEALRYCYALDYIPAEETRTKPPDTVRLKVKIRKDIAKERCRVVAPYHPPVPQQ